MIVLGLTGSIGMGKSTAARILHRLGVPVHDADRAVHDLLAPGGAAVPAVTAAFPAAARNGGVDRAALGPLVFDDMPALRRLEDILHPLVRADSARFLKACRRRRRRIAALEVPLLFETRGDDRCDLVVLVTAPAAVQAARVLRRPGMTKDRLAAIRARQMPDVEKRQRADVVIPTSQGRRPVLRKLTEIVTVLRSESPSESVSARLASESVRRA